MICGNESYENFPYRTSSQLTKFFFDLDLEYAHDGSTRANWVLSVLETMNNKSDENTILPDKELCQVIEGIVDAKHFLNYNNDNAIDDLNKALKSSGLLLKQNSDGVPKIAVLGGEFISTSIKQVDTIKQIIFTPTVFNIPNKEVNDKLVSVMMPFNKAFDETYVAIKRVTDYLKLDCLRADDIWGNSIFIQDIFELIYCAKIVVVDFTGRNPNVMYETGIAHTLGKIVIPITQSINDLPSDLQHHRALIYLANTEGYKKLSKDLHARIKTILDGCAF
jgi:hypothetical protein